MNKGKMVLETLEAYICTTEELIKEVEDATDDMETKLGKYLDVSAVMKQLPLPPELPLPELPPELTNLDDDGDEQLVRYQEIGVKVEQVFTRHSQMALDMIQMCLLTKRVMTMASRGDYGYAAALEIVSIIDQHVKRVNTAAVSYSEKKKLNCDVPIAYNDCLSVIKQLKHKN